RKCRAPPAQSTREDAPRSDDRPALARVPAARVCAGAEVARRSLSAARAHPEFEEARRFPAGVARPLRPSAGAGRVDVEAGGTAPAGGALANRLDSPRRGGPGLRLPQREAGEEAGRAQRRADEGHRREARLLPLATRRGRRGVALPAPATSLAFAK